MRRIACLAALVWATAVQAAVGDAPVVAAALQQSDDMGRLLESPQVPAAAMERLEPQLRDLGRLARECIERHGTDADKLDKDLALLGKPTAGEDAAVAKARRQMEDEQQRAGRALGSCRLLLVRTDALESVLQSRLDTARARQLLARGPSLAALIPALQTLPAAADGLWGYWRASRLGLTLPGWAGYALLGSLTVLALGAGVRARRRLASHAAEPAAEGFAATLSRALASAGARYAVPSALALAWSGFWWGVVWLGHPAEAIAGLCTALDSWLLLAVASRGLLAPPQPAGPPLPCEPGKLRHLDRTLRVAGLLAATGFAVHSLTRGASLPPMLEDLGHALFFSLLAVLVLRLSWLLLDLRQWPGRGLLRIFVTTVLTLAVGAEAAGYRGGGPYLLHALLLSLLVVAGTWLLARLTGDFFDGLDEGRHPWQQALRGRLGADDDHLPGTVWLRLVAGLALWSGAFLLLLPVWEVPASARLLLTGWLADGIRIGRLQLAPLHIIAALAVLGLLLSVAAAVKRRMETRWLRRAQIEEGTRNAFVTLVGYAGAALAALSALAVAGLDLSNLALIAGALSVGIGFGLQNLVNNFVSGLILLFERPIRRGDWILVGGTEGRVHRISIRSTRIRTFDRADVVVPNSELISGQVTNWTLRDLVGRVRVPVGVAYGSDLARVRKILLEIAAVHPLIVAEASVPAPAVLFLGFGDSALNLELRFFVRDINQRLTVVSEVNFASDAAFREAGVAIPFPQRDVHLRDGTSPVAISGLGVEMPAAAPDRRLG